MRTSYKFCKCIIYHRILLFADRVIANQSRKRGNERGGGRDEEMGRRTRFFRSGTFFTFTSRDAKSEGPLSSFQPRPSYASSIQVEWKPRLVFCYCELTRCNLACARASVYNTYTCVSSRMSVSSFLGEPKRASLEPLHSLALRFLFWDQREFTSYCRHAFTLHANPRLQISSRRTPWDILRRKAEDI